MPRDKKVAYLLFSTRRAALLKHSLLFLFDPPLFVFISYTIMRLTALIFTTFTLSSTVVYAATCSQGQYVDSNHQCQYCAPGTYSNRASLLLYLT